jgi:hypothetical protein
MTDTFTARREVLPLAQQKVWPLLAPAAQLGFVLYGGTAIALRLGHRTSIDFDFFSSRSLDQRALTAALPFTRTATALQATPDTLTLLASDTGAAHGEVKISFFAMPGFGRIGQPERTDDGVLRVASPVDLLATKLKTILQRAEAKDYRDIAALLRAGGDLATGLSAARTLFGSNFQPGEALKALAYFRDGDLSDLDAQDQALLIHASTRIGDLPHLSLASPMVD